MSGEASYAPPVPPPLGSDGHCTGFPDGFGPYNFLPCCVEHDEGTSDGQLVDCLTNVVARDTPQLAWIGAVLVLLCVLIMKTLQPIYNWPAAPSHRKIAL